VCGLSPDHGAIARHVRRHWAQSEVGDEPWATHRVRAAKIKSCSARIWVVD
jgi:hypothetical protein